MTNEQKSAISRMLDKSMSYAEISKHLQLPYNSVKSFCRRHSGVVEVRSYESRCKHCGAKQLASLFTAVGTPNSFSRMSFKCTSFHAGMLATL